MTTLVMMFLKVGFNTLSKLLTPFYEVLRTRTNLTPFWSGIKDQKSSLFEEQN